MDPASVLNSGERLVKIRRYKAVLHKLGAVSINGPMRFDVDDVLTPEIAGPIISKNGSRKSISKVFSDSATLCRRDQLDAARLVAVMTAHQQLRATMESRRQKHRGDESDHTASLANIQEWLEDAETLAVAHSNSKASSPFTVVMHSKCDQVPTEHGGASDCKENDERKKDANDEEHGQDIVRNGSISTFYNNGTVIVHVNCSVSEISLTIAPHIDGMADKLKAAVCSYSLVDALTTVVWPALAKRPSK